MPSGSHPVEADNDSRRHWAMLGMIAACCAGPMLLIVVLVSVVGLAIGPAAAIALGLVAGGLCIAVMTMRHRQHMSSSDSEPSNPDQS
jgi:hypothetical protein